MDDLNKWTDVMVDIETTGVQPDRAAILQIAAVKFNIQTREVCSDFFNASLTMPPHRFWSEDTLAWWMKQKRGVLENIRATARPYRDVINEFADWGYKSQGIRFWAKPTTFDFMFCASYFADEKLANPFSYRKATDMNSFINGLYFPATPPEIQVAMEGDAHNALNDVFWQMKVLFAHIDQAAQPAFVEEVGHTEEEITDVSESK